jgi:PAS domain S-box-containing protein
MTVNELLDIADLWPDPVLLVTSDGIALGGNRRIEALLGRPNAALEGCPVGELLSWRDDSRAYLSACARSRQYLPGSVGLRLDGSHSQQWRTEGALLRAATAGDAALVLLRFIPIETVDAQLAALNGQIEALSGEVQRRTMAEDRLRISENRFRQFAEQITDVFWLVDLAGDRFLYLSPAFEKLWGQPSENLAVRRAAFLNAIHDDDRDLVIDSFNAQTRGEKTVTEYRVRRPNGEVRWVLDRGFPIVEDSGAVQRVCGVAVDITSRKRLEDSLRQRTQRLRLLRDVAAHLLTARETAQMVQGLFEIFQGHFGLDAYFAFLGTETSDGLRLESCAGVSEDFERAIARVELGRGVCGRVAKERRPMVLGRIGEGDAPFTRMLQRAGIRAYACFPLMVDDRLFGTLSFGSRSREQFDDGDVTFFQTISDYVTAAYDRLELVSELQEADRRKDLFLATLAHELRNPLAPIRSGLELMPLTRDDPEMAQQVYDAMERQLQQMTRLLDDLLDVSRVTRDKLTLKKTVVDMADVVQSALEISRPAIDAAGHRLTVTLPDEPVLIDADAVRLAQVFSNLLNNAARYTDAGGCIWLTAEASETDVAVHVRDNGIGIAPELLPRLFRPFVQGGTSTRRGQGGLGIGLMLARRLIELHGGRIDAASAGPGQGAEFTVTLARVRAAQPPLDSERARPLTISAGRGLRVLVVDDNRDFAAITARLLSRQGHVVKTAHDGTSALEIAREFRPQAAFLDIGLPDVDGLELARMLRKRAETRDVLLVAVSGYGQTDDMDASKAAGFDRHLVKPVGPQEYSRILAQLQVSRTPPAIGHPDAVSG